LVGLALLRPERGNPDREQTQQQKTASPAVWARFARAVDDPRFGDPVLAVQCSTRQ
jgi:hypothetical protein